MAANILAPVARQRTFTDLGVVAPGALLYTLVSGSPSQPLVTTSDANGLVPNANPLVASAGGLFGPIYLLPGTAYHFKLTDAAGVLIWDQDPVTAGGVGTAPVVSLPDIANIQIDASQGNIFYLLATGNRTLTAPANPTNGQIITIRFTTVGGAYTLTLAPGIGTGGFRGGNLGGPTVTPAGQTDYVQCIYHVNNVAWDMILYVKGY
jgi:hypothetical protein